MSARGWMDQGMELCVWVVVKPEAVESKEAFLNLSFHRLFPLAEISVFSLLPQSVMVNLNTSYKTYLKQRFLWKAFPPGRWMCFFFLLFSTNNRSLTLPQCSSLYLVCSLPPPFPSPTCSHNFNRMFCSQCLVDRR